MHTSTFTTPIAFAVYNRPHTTRKVFGEIAKVRPRKLLVIADGPNSERRDDDDLCAQTRAVIEEIDWPCDVLTNYADKNLGCRQRVSSGLKWIFDHVEEAIILEDDCLPNQSFLWFCQELLDRYREDDRIFQISGTQFDLSKRQHAYSYYFQRSDTIWGWATWKRAWRFYDFQMNLWPEIRRGGYLRGWVNDPQSLAYYDDIFEKVYNGEVDTWAFQWVFSCLVNNGLSAMPKYNLVSNIGFGEHGTHTTDAKHPYASLPTRELSLPLEHPPCIVLQ
jgi:hypothetical protein